MNEDKEGATSIAIETPVRLREALSRALAANDLNPKLGVHLSKLADIQHPPSPLQMALMQMVEQDSVSPEAAARILRLAGHDSGLAGGIARLLKTWPDGAGFVNSLNFLLRARHGKTDDEELRGSIVAILRAHGVDKAVAHSMAHATLQAHSKGYLRDFARIGRGAQSVEDALVSIADTAWREKTRFRAAYREAQAVSAWNRDITWRVQTLVKMARLACGKRGDFVECGVDTGGTACAVMTYLGDAGFADRRFFLFDTFRGLVRDQLTEEEKQTSVIKDERYPDVLDRVRENFADKPFVRIVPGTVPDTLSAFDGEAVAYLHIDMNVTLPEVEALRFFWPKLSPGAPVIFDDYGFPQHHPQREALDAVAEELGVEIMTLPTCQGLLFKP